MAKFQTNISPYLETNQGLLAFVALDKMLKTAEQTKDEMKKRSLFVLLHSSCEDEDER